MKNKFTLLILFFLLSNILLPTVVFATPSNDIKIDINLKKQNSQTDAYDKYEEVNINIYFQAKKLQSGYELKIKLPEQFVEEETIEFDVLTHDDIKAGTATVDKNILAVTFNDYVNTISNIECKLSLSRIIQEKYYSKDGIDLIFECMEKTWTEHIDTEITPLPDNTNFFKYGFKNGQNNEDFYWGLTINPHYREFKNVVIEDTLGPGQKFVEDSFVIIKNAKFDEKGDLINSDDNKHLSLDDFKYEIKDNHFKIELGDIQEGYCITFKVDITEKLDEYFNKGIMKTNEDSYIYTAKEKSITGSGTLDSTTNKGSVKLKKIDDKNPSQTLKGAIFELRNKDNEFIGEYITDDNGIIEVTDLNLNEKYYFKEIQAPNGYELNSKEIEFTIDDSNTIKLLEVANSKSQIPDKPNEPSKPDTDKPNEPDKPDTDKPDKPETDKPNNIKPNKPNKPHKPDDISETSTDISDNKEPLANPIYLEEFKVPTFPV